MVSTLVKLGWWTVAVGLLVLAAGIFVARHQRRAEESRLSDEQKLARTLQTIRMSTPTDRKVLKVLFYGQSITTSGWVPAVVEHWKQTYPNTDFVVENRAIGGFSAAELLRTTEQDLAASYPDLIVFHVYGDHHAYEKIIRLFRSQTSADVIVQTDHGETLPEPVCEEGWRRTLHRPEGCRGVLWLRQRRWNDDMSYHKIPAFAAKYGLAVEPQRQWWRAYLLRTGVAPDSMLVDGLHPNTAGKALLTQFFDQYFDGLVQGWHGETEAGVTDLSASGVGQMVGFRGSRLELITSQPLSRMPVVTIDQVAVDQLDGCYQVTRTSGMENVPEWPAIRQVKLDHDHTAEDWVATITRIDADQKDFAFSVKGSRSGDVGSGDAFHFFVAKGGMLIIDPSDWMVGRAYSAVPVPVKAPFRVTWSVRFACGGEPEVIERSDGAMEYRYLLAAGLTSGSHVARFAAGTELDGGDLRSYAPPLER